MKVKVLEVQDEATHIFPQEEDEMNSRYNDALTKVGYQMLELSTKLSAQEAKPLNADEKQLIRLAVFPQVREMLRAAMFEFIIGREVLPGKGPLDDFLQMVYDLRE